MADIVMASQVALLEEAVGLMDAQNKALLGELGRGYSYGLCTYGGHRCGLNVVMALELDASLRE